MEAATRIYQEASGRQRRDQLILEHIDFVDRIYGSVASNLPADVDAENLKAAGMLGLIEAAQNYDLSRGVEFKTFAYPRIRGAIVDELRRNSPLSQRVMHHIGMIRRAMELHEPPVTPEMLVVETGLSMTEVEECLEAMQLTRSQSIETVPEVNEQKNWRRFDDPSKRMETQESLAKLADCIEELPERERLVFTLYHHEELKLKEIGEVLKISESRVSRILAKVHFRLREMFRISESL